LLLAALAGCSVLPEREPLRVFEPLLAAAPASALARAPQAEWSLLVPRPIAAQALDSERINVRPAPGQVQVYKGAAWSDNAPDLVQARLLRAFEDSGKIVSVSRPGGGMRGQYQLATELRAFESVYAQPGRPEAVIEVRARLLRADGAVVAARGFRQVQPAADEDIDAVVAAFSYALERCIDDVAAWTLVTGNADRAAPAR